MTTYLILDLVCRQKELAAAYGLRATSWAKQNFHGREVNDIIDAVVTRNWVKFWRVRRKADGYVRAVMQWAVGELRRDTLKAFGRAYMGCDVRWILQSATGNEMEWEELVRRENVGWTREGDKITIRKPKVKAAGTERTAPDPAGI